MTDGNSNQGVDTPTAQAAPLPSNPTVTGTPNLNPKPTGKGMTYDQVENIWIQAGGNPQAAAMAAAIADASSGFNPSATRTNPDGTTSIGLWLIPENGMPPGSTDPVANARAALQLSNNGTDWTQWCVAWSDNNCGENGGTYLGSGANALMSLGQRLTPASYNVIGSVPSGTAGSATAAAPSSTSGGSASVAQSSASPKGLLIIGILAFVLFVIIYFTQRRKKAAPEAEEPTE